MTTANPFDLLGDDDNDDPSQLIAAQQEKIVPKKALAPLQVRDIKNEVGHGGSHGHRYGRSQGGGGFYRDSVNNENSYRNNGFLGGQRAPEEADNWKPSERRGAYSGPRPFHGSRRHGFSNGEAGDGEQPRKAFECQNGSGHVDEIKCEATGRKNWATQSDGFSEITEKFSEGAKNFGAEKPLGLGEEDATNANQQNPPDEPEEQKPEDKEMTLEEYEKVLEEKRKVLQTLKTEERKVDVDKDFKSMLQLSSKKGSDGIFIKLGSDKDKRKESAEKEEKSRKSVSINEFLKPAEGERYYGAGGRGRGRGRGSRGGFSAARELSIVQAPAIGDPGQFPTLRA